MNEMTTLELTALETMDATMKAGTNLGESEVRVGRSIAIDRNAPIVYQGEKIAIGEDLGLRPIGNEKFLPSHLDHPAANLQLTSDLLNIEGEFDSHNARLTYKEVQKVSS